MRAVPLAVLLTACVATPEPEEARLAVCWPVPGTDHEMQWKAACRAVAWEEDEVRVDSRRWEVRSGDGLVCHAPPWRDPYGSLWVSLSGTDLATASLLEQRFFEALGMLKNGKTLPAEPPPPNDEPSWIPPLLNGTAYEHRGTR